jgi:head-tail adaptor
MPVNPGRLRDVLTIQTRTEVSTANGVLTVWSDDATIYARVIQTGAMGTARYQQAGYSNVTHVVLMRERTITLRGHRFVWGARVLEPVAPPMSPSQDRFQSVACREITDEVTGEVSSS